MGKFEQEAKDLLEAIGGKDNIRKLMSRLSNPSQQLRELLQTLVNSRLSSEMMYPFFIMILQLFLVSKAFLKRLLNQLPRVTKIQFNV